jgi:hypothetical protein
MNKAQNSIPFSVDVPLAGQNANVRSTDGQTGTICARGTAVAEDQTIARTVWGKVYPTAQVNPPNTPTNDAIGTVPNQNTGAWSLSGVNELPGAACSATAPYPNNTLVLWFDWPGIGFQPYAIYFLGRAATQTDCS